jgi:hypothetical protein
MWQPIETAPKDGTPVLGLCVHSADPYYDGDRLTDYGARCEGLSNVEDGPHVIAWELGQEMSEGWEYPSYWIPGGWFLTADTEKMANPTHWAPIPEIPK